MTITLKRQAFVPRVLQFETPRSYLARVANRNHFTYDSLDELLHDAARDHNIHTIEEVINRLTGLPTDHFAIEAKHTGLADGIGIAAHKGYRPLCTHCAQGADAWQFDQYLTNACLKHNRWTGTAKEPIQHPLTPQSRRAEQTLRHLLHHARRTDRLKYRLLLGLRETIALKLSRDSLHPSVHVANRKRRQSGQPGSRMTWDYCHGPLDAIDMHEPTIELLRILTQHDALRILTTAATLTRARGWTYDKKGAAIRLRGLLNPSERWFAFTRHYGRATAAMNWATDEAALIAESSAPEWHPYLIEYFERIAARRPPLTAA